MQRKHVLYPLAIVALLVAMLPIAAVAQQAPPAQPGTWSLETYAPPAEAKGAVPSGKAAQPGAALEGMLSPDGMAMFGEIEPNNSAATANVLPTPPLVAMANIFPATDVDYFSFTGNAGDRVYAAVMTSFSANSSSDSQLRLYASDGTTEIEFDDDDGTFGGLASSIAGATLPSAGVYYLRVNHFTASTGQLRPYYLYLRLQNGSPTAEIEANDTPATANPLPANGWVSGTRNPAAATEQDWYSFSANAGDTVYLASTWTLSATRCSGTGVSALPSLATPATRSWW